MVMPRGVSLSELETSGKGPGFDSASTVFKKKKKASAMYFWIGAAVIVVIIAVLLVLAFFTKPGRSNKVGRVTPCAPLFFPFHLPLSPEIQEGKLLDPGQNLLASLF